MKALAEAYRSGELHGVREGELPERFASRRPSPPSLPVLPPARHSQKRICHPPPFSPFHAVPPPEDGGAVRQVQTAAPGVGWTDPTRAERAVLAAGHAGAALPQTQAPGRADARAGGHVHCLPAPWHQLHLSDTQRLRRRGGGARLFRVFADDRRGSRRRLARVPAEQVVVPPETAHPGIDGARAAVGFEIATRWVRARAGDRNARKQLLVRRARGATSALAKNAVMKVRDASSVNSSGTVHRSFLPLFSGSSAPLSAPGEASADHETLTRGGSRALEPIATPPIDSPGQRTPGRALPSFDVFRPALCNRPHTVLNHCQRLRCGVSRVSRSTPRRTRSAVTSAGLRGSRRVWESVGRGALQGPLYWPGSSFSQSCCTHRASPLGLKGPSTGSSASSPILNRHGGRVGHVQQARLAAHQEVGRGCGRSLLPWLAVVVAVVSVALAVPPVCPAVRASAYASDQPVAAGALHAAVAADDDSAAVDIHAGRSVRVGRI
eukprot:ctg_1066.g223